MHTHPGFDRRAVSIRRRADILVRCSRYRRHVRDVVALGQLLRCLTVPPTIPFNFVSSSASDLPA